MGIQIIFIVLVFLSAISPKAFKIFTGYQGIYPNPHFFFVLFLIPLFYMSNLLYYKVDKVTFYIILTGGLLSAVYFLSASFSYINAPLYEEAFLNPLLQSTRMLLTYVLFVPFFLLLKNNILGKLISSYLIFSTLNVVLFLIGIGMFLNIIPIINEELFELIREEIYSISFTPVGFLPKWRTVFEETQVMSTHYFMATVISYMYGWKFLAIVFFLFSIYLFSKSVLASWTFFFFLLVSYKMKSGIFRYIFTLTGVLLGSFIIAIFFLEEFKMGVSLYESALLYRSFAERIFHILKTFDYMEENLISIIIGLGPRSYGSFIMQEFPGVFNKDTNAISFFNVFQDVGLLGFAITLSYTYLLYRLIPSSDTFTKMAFLCSLLAYSLQMGWGSSMHILGIIIMVRLSRLRAGYEK